jgi:hypothetical protein
VGAVILRSPPFLLADDEESGMRVKMRRARFFAPLRMTAWKRFPQPARGGQDLTLLLLLFRARWPSL